LAETSIFLTEYKDVIFAGITLFCYLGVYLYPYNPELDSFLLVISIILGVFIIVTLIFDYDKAFYMKYKIFYYQYKQINHKAKKTGEKIDKEMLFGRGRTFADYVRFRGIAGDEIVIDNSE
jgi:hypothetical protein